MRIQNNTSIIYIGQAGFIIRSAKSTLLAVDLYLSDCVERFEGHIGFKRLLPKIISTNDFEFDCIIATHPHLDHYDVDSIPDLMTNNKTELFASMECKTYEMQYSLDKDRIVYVVPGDNYRVKDFDIHFVSCDHGESAPDAVGVIIRVDSKIIYITGDTCLRLDRLSEYKQFGDIDVLIGPINGAYGNMNEKDLSDLSIALQPKLTIPCHYGMFASHGGNPGKFIEIMKNTNLKYMLMAMGEQLIL